MKNYFKNLLIEPYRIFFAAGVVYAFLAVGIWFTWMHGLDHERVLWEWQQFPGFIHSHAMIYGVFGFYVFGFILTAFPRFMGVDMPGKWQVLCLFFALFSAQICFLTASFWSARLFQISGVLELVAYFGLLLVLLRMFLASRAAQPHYQPLFVLTAMFFGGLGVMLGFFYSGLGWGYEWFILSTDIGTYGFLVLMVVSITYRVVPFFASRVIDDFNPQRRPWTLFVVMLLMLGHWGSVLFIRKANLQNYSIWVINLFLALFLLIEWKGWVSKKIKQAPMLLVLFLGLGWILVFLLFSGVEIMLHWYSPDYPPETILRTPALHALYIGSLGTLLVGISTRVVRGHGGLPLVADKAVLVAIILVQIAALIRVSFPLLEYMWPAFSGKSYWSGLPWCVAFGIWGTRYLPLLGKPKVEGVQ